MQSGRFRALQQQESAEPAPSRGGAAMQYEQRLRGLIESLPQLVWSCDAQGQCDYLSPQWAAYTGKPVAGQLGHGWLDCVHEQDREQALAAWAHTLGDGRPYDAEIRIRRHDGCYRWFKCRATAIRDKAGQPMQWFGTSTDIDDMRRASSALQEERDRLRLLAATVPSIVHTLRREANGHVSFPFGAERLADVYGIPAEQLLTDAREMADRVHPDDAPRVSAAMRESLYEGTPWRAEFRLLHPERGQVWVEGHSMPVMEPGGAVVWHGAITDISERKRAERALFESQAQMATVFANLSEGLVICRPDGVLIHWNEAAMKLHGFSSLDECVRHFHQMDTLFELHDLAGQHVPVTQWPAARLIRGEVVQQMEVRLTHRIQGWHKVFNYSGTVVNDGDGQPMLMVLLISDITQRKQHEDEVQTLNAELEHRVQVRTAELQAAMRELEAFSYSVSHDLRAPLRALDGYSQVVLQQHGAALPESGRQYLQVIRQSAHKMGQLIDDLLAFSQLGRQPVQRRQVDALQMVRSALATLAPMQANRQIELRIGDLPPCLCDPAMAQQVWVNLLSNALKYTRNRPVAVIEVGCLAAADPRGAPVYSVRDNGTGFDMRQAHKVFGVFERLHRVEDFEGTGVGLAIVQRIVERHGGHIRVEAEPDRGAAFYFSF
jgi:PAS domain S-box-containing protein